MTDHVSEAVKRIAKAEQDTADIRMIVSAVGDDLASRAKYMHARNWPGTIGGLAYEGTADDVQALMDQLPPVDLSFLRLNGWAGGLRPMSLPIKEDPNRIDLLVDAANFYIKAWRVWPSKETAEVVWYTPVKRSDMLIRVSVDLSDAPEWVTFDRDPIRDGHGIIYDYKRRVSAKFNHPNVERAAAGEHGNWTNPVWEHYTFWWPYGTPWQEAIRVSA
jgi:hypothetical protein